MDWESVTLEEFHILKVFFDLLKSVGQDWRYALAESTRECVVCIYKQDGQWREYYIQNGKRYEYPTCDKSLYDYCLSKLEMFKSNMDMYEYLVENFKIEAGKGKRK